MRLLIACTNCQRRYNAAERKIGTRFRCHCGTILEVKQPKGHNSSVVRCSSCGGARKKANSCSYCSADFTLHERDLNTVCPICFARVSDKAKFCSHCAAVLTAESMAGEDTHLVCPACPSDEKLLSRRLGREKISVLECQQCTGLRLGTESFRQLKQRVAGGAVNLSGALECKPAPITLKKQQGPLYRNCVRCSNMMARKQYAPGSGIIIDFCREHGIWFDSEELHHVLDWILKGGQPTDLVPKALKQELKEIRTRRSDKSVWPPVQGFDVFDVVLSGLFGSLSDMID
jgi:Zn-finger nucleic acid-binding protein